MHDYDLVYGGSENGLMGKVAKFFLERGKNVTSVFPYSNENLLNKPNAICTSDIFERKKVMLEMADIYLVLSGGLGTLDEFSDALLSTIKHKDKQLCIYSHKDFYDDLLTQILCMIDFGFSTREKIGKLHLITDYSNFYEFLMKDGIQENISDTNKFFSKYFVQENVVNYFIQNKVSEDIVNPMLEFLWQQYYINSSKSKKYNAIYWALIFTLESTKIFFNKDDLKLKLKNSLEENSHSLNLNFSNIFEIEYFLFKGIIELDDYATYFFELCEELDNDKEKEYFVNACWLFVENFKETENKILKSKIKKFSVKENFETEILKIWENKLFENLEYLKNGFAIYDEMICNSIMFVGLNPTYKELDKENLGDFCNSWEKEETNYYYKKCKEIAIWGRQRWSHLDLLYFKQSGNNYIDDLIKIPNGKNFISQQLAISKQIIYDAKPKILMITDSLAASFLGFEQNEEESQGDWMGLEYTFDHKFGVYKIINDKILENTPVFFTSILNDDIKDRKSFESLKWHIASVLKQLDQLE